MALWTEKQTRPVRGAVVCRASDIPTLRARAIGKGIAARVCRAMRPGAAQVAAVNGGDGPIATGTLPASAALTLRVYPPRVPTFFRRTFPGQIPLPNSPERIATRHPLHPIRKYAHLSNSPRLRSNGCACLLRFASRSVISLPVSAYVFLLVPDFALRGRNSFSPQIVSCSPLE